MIVPPAVGSLWSSEIQLEPRSGRETVGPRWRLEVSKKRRRGPRAECNTRRGLVHETVDEEIFADALRRPEI